MNVPVSDRLLIDTGLRLDVGAERFALVRCSQSGGSSYLRFEHEIPAAGPDRVADCPSCDGAEHRFVDLDAAVNSAVMCRIEDKGVGLSLAEIVSVTLDSLRRQVAPQPPRRSKSRR